MDIIKGVKDFWKYLKKDTWDSWLVSIVLAFIIIRFMFFPLLAFVTATPLPLVVVESCSMYHDLPFDEWWDRNDVWYENVGINEYRFDRFPFRNGFSKGDIVLVWGRGDYNVGDVIIFQSEFQHPLIHRMVSLDPIGTKGDNNVGQLAAEKNIPENAILGKAVARVPGLGWLKLIFFEPFRSPEQRGLCN